MKKVLFVLFSILVLSSFASAESHKDKIYSEGRKLLEKSKVIARDVIDTSDDIMEDMFDKYISGDADEDFMNWVEYKKFCKKHGIPAYYDHFEELAMVQRRDGLNEKDTEVLILKVWGKE